MQSHETSQKTSHTSIDKNMPRGYFSVCVKTVLAMIYAGGKKKENKKELW